MPAPEEELIGLFVGADHVINMTVYADEDETVAQNITGWTIVLEIRKQDTSTGTPKLTTTAAIVSGVAGTCSFTISDTDLAATVFTGDDWEGRYSIWRTDAGSEQPLRYGDVTVTRTTRT
jgi:hypothetical protein